METALAVKIVTMVGPGSTALGELRSRLDSGDGAPGQDILLSQGKRAWGPGGRSGLASFGSWQDITANHLFIIRSGP